MKFFALITALLLASCMAYAEIRQSTFVLDGWLEVTRSIQASDSYPCTVAGVTGVCSGTGAVSVGAPDGGKLTSVVLTLKNIGAIDREGITLTESLALIPANVKINFGERPFSTDGRSATFVIGSLQSGKSRAITYSFMSSFSEGAMSKMVQPQIRFERLDAAIVATPSVQLGKKAEVSLVTLSGQPISGAKIYVSFPDGSSQEIVTGSEGKAEFVATKEGHYTYSSDSARILKLASTRAISSEAMRAANETGGAESKDGAVSAAASASGSGGLIQSLVGVLPLLAALFVAIIIVVIAYNFFSSKDDEETGEESPKEAAKPSSQNTGYTFSQSYSFQDEAKEERKIEETTRGIIESRKRQLYGGSLPSEQKEGAVKSPDVEAASPPPAAKEEEAKESPEAKEETAEKGAVEEAESGALQQDFQIENEPDQEMTNSEDEQEAEISELSKAASEDGESTVMDDEGLEAAIAKLEEIRARLKASGAEPAELESEEEKPEEAESPEEPEEEIPGQEEESTPSEKTAPFKQLAKKRKVPKESEKRARRKKTPAKKKGKKSRKK